VNDLVSTIDIRPQITVVSFFFPQICPTIRGDFRRFKSIYVSQIPIPAVSSSQQASITKRIDQILAADVSVLEAEIDAIVYDLYGLTKDEIALIEEDR